eukprot:2819514-Prymnesium_polylepis.2
MKPRFLTLRSMSQLAKVAATASCARHAGKAGRAHRLEAVVEVDGAAGRVARELAEEGGDVERQLLEAVDRQVVLHRQPAVVVARLLQLGLHLLGALGHALGEVADQRRVGDRRRLELAADDDVHHRRERRQVLVRRHQHDRRAREALGGLVALAERLHVRDVVANRQEQVLDVGDLAGREERLDRELPRVDARLLVQLLGVAD